MAVVDPCRVMCRRCAEGAKTVNTARYLAGMGGGREQGALGRHQLSCDHWDCTAGLCASGIAVWLHMTLW